MEREARTQREVERKRERERENLPVLSQSGFCAI
jgi:hypothetical protein